MQTGTLGGIASFTVQCGAGAAMVIWPDKLWIAVWVLMASTLGLALSMGWYIRANYYPHLFSGSVPWSKKVEQEERKQRQTEYLECANMAAYEVLRYIVMASAWGRAIANEKNLKVGDPLTIFEAINEFQRGAGQGEVQAIGRLDGKGTHVPIPKVFWHTSTLDASYLGKDKPIQTRPAAAERDGIPVYTDVHVVSSGVYSAWPKAKKTSYT